MLILMIFDKHISSSKFSQITLTLSTSLDVIQRLPKQIDIIGCTTLLWLEITVQSSSHRVQENHSSAKDSQEEQSLELLG